MSIPLVVEQLERGLCFGLCPLPALHLYRRVGAAQRVEWTLRLLEIPADDPEKELRDAINREVAEYDNDGPPCLVAMMLGLGPEDTGPVWNPEPDELGSVQVYAADSTGRRYSTVHPPPLPRITQPRFAIHETWERPESEQDAICGDAIRAAVGIAW